MLTRHMDSPKQNRIGNRVWIFAAFFAAALAFDLAMQQTAAADEPMTTFFSDNYNVNGNKKGTAIGGPSDNDKPERFSVGACYILRRHEQAQRGVLLWREYCQFE